MGQHHDSRQDAGSVYQQKATRQRMASEMRVKLRNYSFTHLITLATNNQDYSLRRMRSVLQTWDARINRWLVGPKWHQRPDERLLWFAFLEKLEANPHWHLLAEIDPQLMLRATSQERCRQLEERGRRYWKSIVPGGHFRLQAY